MRRREGVRNFRASPRRLDEWSDGDVETWVVPSGAALPDPNAVEEASAEDETGRAEEVSAIEEKKPKEF
jgi:hypothetical protein